MILYLLVVLVFKGKEAGSFSGLKKLVEKYEKRDTRDSKLRETFYSIDKNDDGYINTAEMRQSMGEEFTDADIDLIIGLGDTDQDGQLDYEGLLTSV